MSATIYYFSATGNSLSIARKIAEGIGDCKVQSMAGSPPEEPVGAPIIRSALYFPFITLGCRDRSNDLFRS
jgi:hypothetical protein